MLTLQQIRNNSEDIIARLKIKNFDGKNLIEKTLELDDKRRGVQKNLDELKNKSNTLAKEIGQLIKQGKNTEAEKAKTETSALKENIKNLESKLSQIEKAVQEQLLLIPNPPHPDVPTGKTSADNKIIFEHGTMPSLSSNAKPHWEIANQLGIIDFELGVKITGAGFPVYRGKGARLQRALINFFLDEAQKAGYEEIEPPILINKDSGFGTGQIPDKEGQMYEVPIDGFYLIPTAEVPVTNIYRDVILAEKDLPIKHCAYTPCFRREAGSYGKDVRGLNRIHQFDKVEIVQIVVPEKSYEILEEMRAHVASLLTKLEITFRTVLLCGGEMGHTQSKTYDFEVYSGVQKKWLEVSSVSNFESFQANRMKLRYKNPQSKTELLHTLNGSALALPRLVAGLLENNQTKEGKINIPKMLQPYTGFEII